MTTTIGNLMFRAAEKAGDSAKVRLCSERLGALTSTAGTGRPDVKRAVQFSSKR